MQKFKQMNVLKFYAKIAYCKGVHGVYFFEQIFSILLTFNN